MYIITAISALKMSKISDVAAKEVNTLYKRMHPYMTKCVFKITISISIITQLPNYDSRIIFQYELVTLEVLKRNFVFTVFILTINAIAFIDK